MAVLFSLPYRFLSMLNPDPLCCACLLQLFVMALWIFLDVLFYVYDCFCLFVCTCTSALRVFKARRRHWIHWNWSHRWLWAILVLLGTKPGYLARSVSALHHWVIFPAPCWPPSGYTSFLWRLWQITKIWVSPKKRNSFSHSYRGQNREDLDFADQPA